MTNYLAIAFGRGALRERLYGVVLPFESDEYMELREFESRAGRGLIDILYKGPNKRDAKKLVEGLRGWKRVLDYAIEKGIV